MNTDHKAIILFLLFCFSILNVRANESVYPVVSDLNVRIKPETQSKIIGRLPAGQWVNAEQVNNEWTKVLFTNNQAGFVSNKYITDLWIKVLKKERKLHLMSDKKKLKTYTISLGFNPLDDKHKRGDGCTPEGRFYICEMLSDPQPKEKYGSRSMRISYPDIEDARRGLKDKIISTSDYHTILRQVNSMKKPLQNTILGGSIRIHGGGIGRDWTLGCIAMNDSDINELFSKIPARNTMVEIYKNQHEDERINKTGSINTRVLKASKKILTSGCSYTKTATGIIKIGFPMGDFDPGIGVCTDVVIRVLREAGLDLQALLYEDIKLNKNRYPGISKPDTNIDHRRTRNLKIWFDHHSDTLTNTAPALAPEAWQAGDIVIMDTGISNGTIYDHIGIVSDIKKKKRPLVINLWTIGSKINEMDLLDGEYPVIVGHYRLQHPFNY